MYLRKPGPKPGALAFKNYRPGQKPPQAKHRARLGPAFGLRQELAHHYMEVDRRSYGCWWRGGYFRREWGLWEWLEEVREHRLFLKKYLGSSFVSVLGLSKRFEESSTTWTGYSLVSVKMLLRPAHTHPIVVSEPVQTELWSVRIGSFR